MQTGLDVRKACRSGEHSTHTSGIANGYAQANMVILPSEYAYDFLLFCQRNPKPCPLLEVTDKGSSITKIIANKADIKTDLPLYRIWTNGCLEKEVTDITNYWRDDLVGFLLGCSFSFEASLEDANLPVRHNQLNKNVPMYNTNIECKSAGIFSGKMVVSMRPYRKEDVAKVVEITSKYPNVHGGPIHIGNPSEIGIGNIKEPDYGDSPNIYDDEIPVFWACGVTPQKVLMDSKPDFAITHAPGHMFVCDLKNIDFSEEKKSNEIIEKLNNL